jgi:hypothetical protein
VVTTEIGSNGVPSMKIGSFGSGDEHGWTLVAGCHRDVPCLSLT